MEKDKKIVNLAERLFNLQQDMEAVKKDTPNEFFKSKYYNINGLIGALKPLLKKHGLFIVQPLVVQDGRTVLKTVIGTHELPASVETDTIMRTTESTVYLPEITDPQKMGSAITYYRRYALTSLLMIEAEDDDGNVAAKAEQKPNNEDVPF